MQRFQSARFLESSPHPENRYSLDRSPHSTQYSDVYSDAHLRSHHSSSVGATALISAGILVLAIWAVTLVFKSISWPPRAQRAVLQTAVAPAAHRDDDSNNLPALDAEVMASAMGIYHWSADCPLATAHSLRHGGKSSPQLSLRHAVHLTRREAELRGLHACRYCREIEYWRKLQTHPMQAHPTSAVPNVL